MKNSIVHFIRYGVILLPVLFLIFVITHIHNHTEQMNQFANNNISDRIKPPGMLSTSQLQSLMELKKDTIVHDLLPSLPTDLKIN